MLAVTWSLAIEEQFYLTLPLLIALLSRRALWRLMVTAIFVAPLLRMLALHFLSGGGIKSYVLTPCRADALGFGGVAALAVRTPTVWSKVVAHRLYVFAGLGLSCLAALCMLIRGRYEPLSGTLFRLEYSLLGCLYFVLLLSVLLSPAVSSLFLLRPLRYMGVIAYGAYILYLPLIAVLRELGVYLHPASRGVTTLASSVIAVAGSLALASLSWEYFEKPLVKRGHRWRYSRCKS